jgi:gluconokinase
MQVHPSSSPAGSLVVMGVAGCGKSTLGQAVARALGRSLIEGDDFHPPASIAKMKSGTPLGDADRAQWLAVLGRELAACPSGAVLTCSALKADYRQGLRRSAPGLRFAYLRVDRAEALRRVAARASQHLFPPSLVDSQFAALESPEAEAGVLTLDATLPLAELCRLTARWMQESAR